MNLNSLIYHPRFLMERGKVSRELLDNAASAGMTFGFETEFYVEGVWELLKNYLAANTRTTQQGQIVKPVTSLRWHDLVVYFEPVAMTQKEVVSGLDNEEIKLNRLTYAYQKLAKDETPAAPDEMFAALKKHFGAGGVLMVLGLFPSKGFAVPGATNNGAEDRIREFRKSPSKELLSQAGKFAFMNVMVAKSNEEFEDSLSFDEQSPKRQVVLDMIGQIASEFLGAEVVTTLNPDHSSKVSEGYSKWTLTVDESLKKDDKLNTIGLELISPVSDINTGFKNVANVFSLLKNFGQAANNKRIRAFTSEDTGFHINLGLGQRPIDVLKLIFMLDDNYIQNKFQRAGNSYAINTLRSVISKVRSDPANIEAIINTVEKAIPLDQQDMAYIMDKLKASVERKKFLAINLSKLAKHHFVEFRSIGNANYEDRLDDVLQIIRTFATMMYAASDPTVYRNEYLTKVMKVVKNLGDRYKEPLPGMGPQKDVLALVQQAKAAPAVKMLARMDRLVARSYMDVSEFLNAYEKTGRINGFAFRAAVNNLVKTILQAQQSGAAKLGKPELAALRSYVEILKQIGTALKTKAVA